MFAIFQVRTTGAELSDREDFGEFVGIIRWTYNFNITLGLEQEELWNQALKIPKKIAKRSSSLCYVLLQLLWNMDADFGIHISKHFSDFVCYMTSCNHA